jgi:hypothetical protein
MIKAPSLSKMIAPLALILILLLCPYTVVAPSGGGGGGGGGFGGGGGLSNGGGDIKFERSKIIFVWIISALFLLMGLCLLCCVCANEDSNLSRRTQQITNVMIIKLQVQLQGVFTVQI